MQVSLQRPQEHLSQAETHLVAVRAFALSKEGKKLHEQINYPLSPVKLQVFWKLSAKRT